MSILITGGRGKIARAVHAGLVAQGRDVRVASREPADLPGAIALDPAHPVSLANASTASLRSSCTPTRPPPNSS
ncbi:hypothetical protein [Kribbella sp. CA-294648]|uniref:hypothetical protein n=1 Tax=Kribbella sp. CA-294648 TaxID=3239948 RepID=UPI003D8C80DF